MELVFSLIQQVPIGDLIEVILYVIGSAFSLILLSLSISAYRKNPQKRLLYAITAFSLFGVFLTYENFEHALTFENPFADITIPASTLAILVLFFLAILKEINRSAFYCRCSLILLVRDFPLILYQKIVLWYSIYGQAKFKSVL